MEIQDFIKHFGEQFEDTDASTFTPETKFRELEEWSSLIALSVMAMADEVYGVALKGDDIRKSSTVEDLFNIVKAQL
jgi:acyl carrier protein